MKKNNKGFTLVELIVVLVILAILAAILVPALLGYIDRAREKQYVLNAKSWLTAAQAEMSSIYGEGLVPACIEQRSATVSKTADVPDCKSFKIWCAADAKATDVKADSDHHANYTIKGAEYVENGITLYYTGTAWVKSDSDGASHGGDGTELVLKTTN